MTCPNGTSPHTWGTILRTIPLHIPYKYPISLLCTVCDREIWVCVEFMKNFPMTLTQRKRIYIMPFEWKNNCALIVRCSLLAHHSSCFIPRMVDQNVTVCCQTTLLKSQYVLLVPQYPSTHTHTHTHRHLILYTQSYIVVPRLSLQRMS